MSNQTDCYKYSLLISESGCAPRIFLWNYGSAAYLLLADFHTIVPSLSVMCLTLPNWYLSERTHFSFSDPMWDRRDSTVTLRGAGFLKGDVSLQESRSADVGAGAVKGPRALGLGPEHWGKKETFSGMNTGAALGRVDDGCKKQCLLKVTSNSQFGICLWFLTAGFSKRGQIASNRAYFCSSTQVWSYSHSSHYVSYTKYIIF